MEWAIFGAGFILSFIVLAILGDAVRKRGRLRQQELLQKERLAALEKGLPLPEWDASLLDDDAVPVSREVHERRMQWFRFMTLCLGVVLVSGGLGLMIAFELSGDPEFNKLTSIGMIPVMTGIGLLLFHFLSRNESR